MPRPLGVKKYFLGTVDYIVIYTTTINNKSIMLHNTKIIDTKLHGTYFKK